MTVGNIVRIVAGRRGSLNKRWMLQRFTHYFILSISCQWLQNQYDRNRAHVQLVAQDDPIVNNGKMSQPQLAGHGLCTILVFSILLEYFFIGSGSLRFLFKWAMWPESCWFYP